MLLKESGITLTELEKKCITKILEQGSFFEESGGNEDVREWGTTFIGYQIDETEIPGCRGALASLVKKGVISIGYDEDNDGKEIACYFIRYELTFLPEEYGYHKPEF